MLAAFALVVILFAALFFSVRDAEPRAAVLPLTILVTADMVVAVVWMLAKLSHLSGQSA